MPTTGSNRNWIRVVGVKIGGFLEVIVVSLG